MNFLSKIFGPTPQEPTPAPQPEKPKNPRIVEIDLLLQNKNISEFERNQLIFERNAIIRGEASQTTSVRGAMGVEPSVLSLSPEDAFEVAATTANSVVAEKMSRVTDLTRPPLESTSVIAGEQQVPAFLLKANQEEFAKKPTEEGEGQQTTGVGERAALESNPAAEPAPNEQAQDASEQKAVSTPSTQEDPLAQKPKMTLHYSIGGKEQTFVVGEQNQVPNLGEAPAFTSTPLQEKSQVQEKAVKQPVSAGQQTENPMDTVLNYRPGQPEGVAEQNTRQRLQPSSDVEVQRDNSQEKINGYISRAAAKGYPENIFSGCTTEHEIVKAMGSFMKEKYYELGYPHDLFTSCDTPIEVKNTAIAYRENLIHERALEEQARLAQVAGIRPNTGEAPQATLAQEARREVVTPEARAVSERINAVRDAQEERVSSRRIPGGWWSRNKEKVTGTAGILGGALGIAALAFCLFGKTCTVPAGTNEVAPVAAPVAAAVQDCQKKQEIKAVKKKVVAAVKKATPQSAGAEVRIREVAEPALVAPAPQVVAVPAEPVVTAVPSAPTATPTPGFRDVLPATIPVAQNAPAAQVIYQTTVWNPGMSSYYNGGSTTYVYNNGSNGGGSAGIAPRPGTAPIGGTTPVQPPQAKPPLAGPVTGGAGGGPVPPPGGSLNPPIVNPTPGGNIGGSVAPSIWSPVNNSTQMPPILAPALNNSSSQPAVNSPTLNQNVGFNQPPTPIRPTSATFNTLTQAGAGYQGVGASQPGLSGPSNNGGSSAPPPSGGSQSSGPKFGTR